MRCVFSLSLGLPAKYCIAVSPARLPRLASDWRSLVFSLRPSPAELRAMVRALVKRFGFPQACSLLGVSGLTVKGWLRGSMVPSGGASRAIWLVWVLCFHPDRLSTLGDLVTWGRFKVQRRAPSPSARAEPSRWSGWSI